MPTPWSRRTARLVAVCLMLWVPERMQGQLPPSPAVEAAEEMLDLVRAGNEDHLRKFIETRFTPELRDMAPMDQQLQMFDFFRRDIEGREVSGIELRGPTDVSYFLKGPANRLEMRLRVEPEPPHRIAGLRVRDAGPEIGARSLDEMGAELERLAARDEFSGVVLAASSGEIRFHKGYGLADRETGRPIQPDTRFDIGSLNKLFTSTAILRLAQDGHLDLSDPIGKYLDGFGPQVAEHVTIRHLLQHRSGFGDYLTHPQFVADPKRFRRPADFLPHAREQELAFEPGAGRRYSNMGFVLLGAIIERVTGRGYHQVIDDLVFGPAGMASANSVGGTAAARRYDRKHGRFISTDSLYPDVGSPAGGGFAAAMDLHRFIHALLDHRLLNEGHTALLLNDFEAPTADRTLPEEFGFAGGAPGVNAFVLVRTPERRSVVVLGNVTPFAADAIARRIQTLLN